MAAGETCVQFGDLFMWNCQTHEFRQEAIFDESNTDLLYYKFNIRVTGWVTNLANANMGTLPNPSGTSAGARQAATRYTMAPRQYLAFLTGALVDGTGVIVQPGNITYQALPVSNSSQLATLAGYDLNNGPKCLSLTVTQINNDSLFKVDAEFEACTLVCTNSQSVTNTQGVLSNRWSVSDDVDQDMMTTRTFSGKLRIAAGVVNPNQFRNWVVPAVQPGMRRISMNFSVSTDALWLAYTITDREIAYSAPAPATTWSFEHTESASREGQLLKYGEVRVSLNGDRYVDHRKLIAIGLSIAQAKLTKGAANQQCALMEVTVTDRYGDNDNGVSIYVKGYRFPKDGAILGLPTAVLGIPISAQDLATVSANYDYRLSRGARSGDVIETNGPIELTAAFSAYLQQPCNDNHLMSQVQFSDSDKTPQKSHTKSVNLVSPETLANDNTNSYFNNAANQSIYTFYQMQSSYETDCIRAHCPIAVTNNSPGSSGGATGSTATSIVGNLAAPMTRRVIRIKGERVGTWPAMPLMLDSYVDGNTITYTLLESSDNPIQPDRSPDAKQLYTIDRAYTYAMSRAPNPSDTIVVGVNPWDNSQQLTKQFDPGIPESQYPIS